MSGDRAYRAVGWALAAVVIVVLAGCSSTSDTATSTTRATTTTSCPSTSSSTSTTTTTVLPAPTPTTTPPAPASGPCRTGAPALTAGAKPKQIIDVDGDGKADTAFVVTVGGNTTINIRTAAGGGASTPFVSASPVTRSVLVVNVDQQGPAEIIADDGRQAELYAFVDCAIQPVLNPQGQIYTFDLENLYGTGTGIGCNSTPAGRRLVGLDRIEGGDSSTVSWSRTIVELNGLSATNGVTTRGTFTRGRDDAAIASLDDVSCGNLTIERDGVADGQ